MDQSTLDSESEERQPLIHSPNNEENNFTYIGALFNPKINFTDIFP